MSFVVSYRDPRYPDIAGVISVRDESEVEAAVYDLRREGCQITEVYPPILSLVLDREAPPIG